MCLTHQISCAQEMCPTHQIFCVQEMFMKYHLFCFVIFSFMPESAYRKCEGNVLEMSCVLATGNVPEILCVLVQEMYLKFCPILPRKSQGNVTISNSWCWKCPCHMNFPPHFMGFPYPGNLGFLPMGPTERSYVYFTCFIYWYGYCRADHKTSYIYV